MLKIAALNQIPFLGASQLARAFSSFSDLFLFKIQNSIYSPQKIKTQFIFSAQESFHNYEPICVRYVLQNSALLLMHFSAEIAQGRTSAVRFDHAQNGGTPRIS